MYLFIIDLLHLRSHFSGNKAMSDSSSNTSAAFFPSLNRKHLDIMGTVIRSRQQGHRKLLFSTVSVKQSLQNTCRHPPALTGSLISSKQIAHMVSSNLFRGLCCLQKSELSQAFRLHLYPRRTSRICEHLIVDFVGSTCFLVTYEGLAHVFRTH